MLGFDINFELGKFEKRVLS